MNAISEFFFNLSVGISFLIFFMVIIFLILSLIVYMSWLRKLKPKIQAGCNHQWVEIPCEIEATGHPTVFHARIKTIIPVCKKCGKQVEPEIDIDV